MGSHAYREKIDGTVEHRMAPDIEEFVANALRGILNAPQLVHDEESGASLVALTTTFGTDDGIYHVCFIWPREWERQRPAAAVMTTPEKQTMDELIESAKQEVRTKFARLREAAHHSEREQEEDGR
jgi:hypothetical protein